MANDFKHTIIIVDDEEGILKSLKRLLKNIDANVLTFTDGREVLEYLKTGQMSLIISDQRMPNITGVELLEKSRQLSPDSVRILLTGYADIAATTDAINSGAVRYYFNKPWDDEFLLSRIKESLDLYQVTIENKRLNIILQNQNEQLKIFNKNLEIRVLEQTREIKRQHEDLSKSFMGTIKSFSTIIDLRYKDIGSHSQRVAQLVSRLGKVIGLGQKEYQDVIIASYLHDIGKIGLSDKILSKNPKEYQKSELESYQNHPILGHSCLYGINGFEDVAIIIRHHHESYNGSGYPDNLREKRIPLGSRMIRMADTFDKLAFEKGYPTSKVLKEAAAHLVEYSGIDFDPDLVKKFIEHDLAQSYIIPESPETIIVRPFELEVGMILSSDIYTNSGMFLLPKGAKLSAGMIKRIMKIDSLDPVKDGVKVNKTTKKKEEVNVKAQATIS